MRRSQRHAFHGVSFAAGEVGRGARAIKGSGGNGDWPEYHPRRDVVSTAKASTRSNGGRGKKRGKEQGQRQRHWQEGATPGLKKQQQDCIIPDAAGIPGRGCGDMANMTALPSAVPGLLMLRSLQVITDRGTSWGIIRLWPLHKGNYFY